MEFEIIPPIAHSRKRKGIARVRLPDGTIMLAEVH